MTQQAQATPAVPAFDVLGNLGQLVGAALQTQTIDMTQTTAGGGFDPYETGDYIITWVEYLELGKRIPTKAGVPTGKPAAHNVKLGYYIHGGDQGSRVERTFDMTMSNNERAGFKKIFDKMNAFIAGGAMVHGAQILSLSAYVTIVKELKKGSTTEYVNTIDWGTLRAVPKFNPQTGEAMTIPEFPQDIFKIFLWNNPTAEMWDSLFIEGTNDKGKSKNWLQEHLLKAVDYNGSMLQALVEGTAGPIPAAPAAPVDNPADPADAPAAPAAATAQPIAPVAAPVAPIAPVA